VRAQQAIFVCRVYGMVTYGVCMCVRTGLVDHTDDASRAHLLVKFCIHAENDVTHEQCLGPTSASQHVVQIKRVRSNAALVRGVLLL
jgi:hypothetical protein